MLSKCMFSTQTLKFHYHPDPLTTARSGEGEELSLAFAVANPKNVCGEMGLGKLLKHELFKM